MHFWYILFVFFPLEESISSAYLQSFDNITCGEKKSWGRTFVVCNLNESNELVFIVVRRDIWFIQKNRKILLGVTIPQDFIVTKNEKSFYDIGFANSLNL